MIFFIKFKKNNSMKKISYLLVIMFSFANVSAQDSQITTTFNPNEWNKLFTEKGKLQISNSKAYPIKNYVSAKVTGLKNNVDLIYNALTDEFELESEDGIATISKKNGRVIKFVDGRTYFYTQYYINGKSKNGFLQVLTDPLEKNILFKQVEVNNIVAERNPYNSHEDLFYTLDERYLITTENRIENINSSLVRSSNLLKKIVKPNNLNIKNENDLRKLVVLLNK